MQDQFQSFGQFKTEHGQKYVTQLCKHFAHKIPAVAEGDTGKISFEMGTVDLTADASTLSMTATGSDQQAVTRMQGVIDSHLERFAFREDFKNMGWSPITPV